MGQEVETGEIHSFHDYRGPDARVKGSADPNPTAPHHQVKRPITTMIGMHRPFRSAAAATIAAAPHRRSFASWLIHHHHKGRYSPSSHNDVEQHSGTGGGGPQTQRSHSYHSTAALHHAVVPTFQALPLIHKVIKKNLHHMKIETMTKVQHDSFYALTKGMDVNILSPPDTGKTLAFLLPFLNEKLKVQGIKKGIHCVFLTPDSHHASQNYLFASELLQLMGPNITVQSLYEQYSYERQVQRLSKKVPTILIATPGRLRQLVEKAVLSKKISRKSPKKKSTDFAVKFTGLTNTLVLDEADVLFRDHRDDVEFIRPYLAMGSDNDRHTVLLSSYSWPDEEVVKTWTRAHDYEKIDCWPKPQPANPPVRKMHVAFADAEVVEVKNRLLKKRWRRQLKRLRITWKEKVAVQAVPDDEK
jgi:superfamily II DNA/RNA helicase